MQYALEMSWIIYFCIQALDEGKLAHLYSELSHQDRLELDWKKVKADNGDEDGAQEAMLRKKFFSKSKMDSYSMNYILFSVSHDAPIR